jgi:hypothetical protein
MKQAIAYYQTIYNNISIWQIATSLELVIIVLLIFKIKSIRKKIKLNGDKYVKDIIQESKEKEIDMDNVVNSMFHSKAIYDILKKKIHPDRFPNDPDKIAIANELTAQLNESQNNIAKMKEIQTLATEKLGIKF